jgi:hypothetical protein
MSKQNFGKFFEKQFPCIERAIRAVAVGKPFFSPAIARSLLEDDVRLDAKAAYPRFL